MRICAIICEFNPFHNGHKYLLEKARELSKADAIICIMSGSFTQRGDICIADKYTRAKHAILGGADAVIQLPASFAVAPAEIFASGAVSILSSIPAVANLAFGCENPDLNFYNQAKILLDECERFKTVFSQKISEGDSFIKSYSAAFTACGGNCNLLEKPNNILALEYVKAIIKQNCNVIPIPIKRIGCGYCDDALSKNYSSASAIRKNLKDPGVKNNLPEFVFKDLSEINEKEYENFLRYALFTADSENIKKVFGCNEGLENKLKSLSYLSLTNIIESATSKRYSSSRIRRILIENALKLYQDDCLTILKNGAYVRLLAVKKEKADNLLKTISESRLPVFAGNKLLNGVSVSKYAEKCIENDKRELETYNFILQKQDNDRMIII